MAILFDNEFEDLFTQSPVFEGPESPNCDVIIDDVPFCNSLLETDNILLSNVIQGKIEHKEKSPFHESDSGMAESVESPGNSESPENSDFMEDDWLEEEPFFNNADKDLLSYLGGDSSSDDDDDDDFSPPKLRSHNKENVDRKKSVGKRKLSERVSTPKKIPVNNVTPVARPQKMSKVDVMSGTDDDLITDEVQPPEIQTLNIKSVKVKVIQTSPNTADYITEPIEAIKALEEKSRKNAIHARINRQKKKAYIKGLENEVETLRTENSDLKSQNEMINNRNAAMEEEVHYLKSVLANACALSKLITNIENVKGVRLSSKFQSRKRNTALDHDYDSEPKPKKAKPSTAGICLHVDNNEVSLEFCSHCSKMAKSDENK